MRDLQTMTPEQLRSEAVRCDRAAADSFDRCDTDGFLSQWASDMSAQLYRRQAEITEAGGVAEFPCLFTLGGERVHARPITTRYGARWLVEDTRFPRFLPYLPVRASTLAKHGLCERRINLAAKAKIVGSGHGLAGCANAHVAAVPLSWDF